jgi:hypothetical protein
VGDPVHLLYEEYVRSGYLPGGACVHENCYMLPVLGLGTVIDLLTCRLDVAPAPRQPPGAWTRLRGSGAKVAALCSRVTDAPSREPELLGVEYEGARRVLTCSYFNPSQNTHHDADGSTPQFSLETRAFPTGQLDSNLVARLRVRYKMSDNEGEPKLRAEVATEQPVLGGSVWGAFTWGSAATWATPGEGTYEPLSGEAPPSLEARKPFSWRLHKKRVFVRFRLTCSQPTAQLTIKHIEVFVRPGGRA